MPPKYAEVTRPVRVLVLELDDKQLPIAQEALVARRGYYARSGTLAAQAKQRICEEILDQLGVDVLELETPAPSPNTPLSVSAERTGGAGALASLEAIEDEAELSGPQLGATEPE